MSRIFKLENDAIFISDAHANENRKQFLGFLNYINSQKQPPKQIFMLGDMFDYLSNTDYVQKFYEKEIKLINEISQKCEIFYFEGNHDFNLKNIFPNAEVFPIKNQPVIFKSEFDDLIQVAHGDIYSSKPSPKYLRNKLFLKIANSIDKICNFAVTKKQSQKNLDKKLENFTQIIGEKIHHYTARTVIEGHYHQDEILHFGAIRYINLNSFALKMQIYRFKEKSNEFEKIVFEFK